MKALFTYGTNYLINANEAVIVDVEATPARWSAEVATTKTILTRTRQSFGLAPQTLAADGSGLVLGWLMRQGIEPHIPILDREHQTNGHFTRADFIFDAAANVFISPASKQLTNIGLVREDGEASTLKCPPENLPACLTPLPLCGPISRMITSFVMREPRSTPRD